MVGPPFTWMTKPMGLPPFFSTSIPEEWMAGTRMTVASPAWMEPPMFPQVTPVAWASGNPPATSALQRSKLVISLAPVRVARATASPTWSPWPWVMRM